MMSDMAHDQGTGCLVNREGPETFEMKLRPCTERDHMAGFVKLMLGLDPSATLTEEHWEEWESWGTEHQESEDTAANKEQRR